MNVHKLPEFDVSEYTIGERYPPPHMRCEKGEPDDFGGYNVFPRRWGYTWSDEDEESDDHYKTTCRIQVTENIYWTHWSHKALWWELEWTSYSDAKKFYVKALVEKPDGAREYHAELVMSTSKPKAWHIFDIAVTVGEEYRILGDTSVIQLGPDTVQVNGKWVEDDMQMIDQILGEW